VAPAWAAARAGVDVPARLVYPRLTWRLYPGAT